MMAMNAAETGHLVLSTLHTNDAAETVNRVLGTVSAGMQAGVRAQLASVLVGVVSQRLLRKKDGKGRIAAVEILVTNQRVRDMISDPARTVDLTRLIEQSQSQGMQSFDQSLMQHYQSGFISKEEALNNCTNLRDFQLRLEGVVAGDWRDKEERTTTRADQVKQMLNTNASGIIEIEGIAEDGSISRVKKK